MKIDWLGVLLLLAGLFAILVMGFIWRGVP